MEDKYYTPKIEEFHKGFEYQRNEYDDYAKDNRWYTTTIDTDWQLVDYIMYLINHGFAQTRVKYLDREDIDSLGWELDIVKIGDNLLPLHRLGNYVITTSQKAYNNSKILDISYITSIGPDKLSRVFRGTIKNKSELSKLMKQLGLNDSNKL